MNNKKFPKTRQFAPEAGSEACDHSEATVKTVRAHQAQFGYCVALT